MILQRYRIYELSARAVMSYAREEDSFYKYDLDAAAVDHCLVSSATHEQDSNALFFQILSHIHGKRFREEVTEEFNEELSEIIFYMNFQKVFDTKGRRQREITRQKKAESLLKSGQAGSVSRVALQCGFSDSNYFSKMYKNAYGISPSQEKKRLEQENHYV